MRDPGVLDRHKVQDNGRIDEWPACRFKSAADTSRAKSEKVAEQTIAHLWLEAANWEVKCLSQQVAPSRVGRGI